MLWLRIKRKIRIPKINVDTTNVSSSINPFLFMKSPSLIY